jgi:voltage-gated potassium channel Kch
MHLVQVVIWAGTFWGLGCFNNFYQALYFSLVTYSTVGYGDLVAPTGWKVFGGVEALMGMLMFGWSASFLFSTVSQFYKFRMRGQESSRV